MEFWGNKNSRSSQVKILAAETVLTLMAIFFATIMMAHMVYVSGFLFVSAIIFGVVALWKGPIRSVIISMLLVIMIGLNAFLLLFNFGLF